MFNRQGSVKASYSTKITMILMLFQLQAITSLRKAVSMLEKDVAQLKRREKTLMTNNAETNGISGMSVSHLALILFWPIVMHGVFSLLSHWRQTR